MDTATYTPDNLIAGDLQRLTEEVTLEGSPFTRGTVLGKITATGKCVAVNSAGTDDGRRDPYAVLAETKDASDEDQTAIAFLTGEFAESALVFGGTDTADTHRAALREKGIFIRSTTAVS